MVLGNVQIYENGMRKIANVFNSFASVAQLVEQLTLNQLVSGSSPDRGTTRKPRNISILRGFCFEKPGGKTNSVARGNFDRIDRMGSG